MDFEEMRGAYLRATQDDIVPRLRHYYLNDKKVDRIVYEAADEIERLRRQCTRLS